MIDSEAFDNAVTAVAWFEQVQLTGVPGRFEPMVGEISCPYLFQLFDRFGYDGCEHCPQSNTRAGLGWAADYGIRACCGICQSTTACGPIRRVDISTNRLVLSMLPCSRDSRTPSRYSNGRRFLHPWLIDFRTPGV